MLTFSFVEDDYVSDIINESKPLRDKFKFVMIKIAEKWLSVMREQRQTWNINEFKSYHPNFIAKYVKDEILDLSSKFAGIAIWNETVALKIEKDILDLLSDAYFELRNSKMDSFLQKIKDHLETTTNDYFDKTMTCQNVTDSMIIMFPIGDRN